MEKFGVVRFFSSSSKAADPSGPHERVRNPQTGRYIPLGTTKNVNSGRAKRLIPLLRNFFDNRFIVSFVRFVFNYLISRVLSNQAVSSKWYTRALGLFTSLAKLINWGLVLSIIGAILIYIYERISGFIKSILGRAYPSDGFLDKMKTVVKNLFSKSTTQHESLLWQPFQQVKNFVAGSTTQTDTFSWFPSSLGEKVVMVIVGTLLLYMLIRYVVRRIITGLFNLFSWATPSDLRTLKEVVGNHSADALGQIRELGNYVIMMDSSLKELEKETKVAQEVKDALKDLGTDVADIRRLEQEMATFTSRLSNRLDTIAQSDTMNKTLIPTLQAMVAKVVKESQTPAMKKTLIDVDTFLKSYETSKAMKAKPGIGHKFYPLSVRKLLDPNAEITDEVGRISHILQNLEDKPSDDGSEAKTWEAFQAFTKKLREDEAAMKGKDKGDPKPPLPKGPGGVFIITKE